MTVYVVVLTAFLGLANVKELVIQCPTAACVFEIEDHASRQPAITRMRVWKAGKYAPLAVSGKPIWPPLRDLHFG